MFCVTDNFTYMKKSPVLNYVKHHLMTSTMCTFLRIFPLCSFDDGVNAQMFKYWMMCDEHNSLNKKYVGTTHFIPILPMLHDVVSK